MKRFERLCRKNYAMAGIFNGQLYIGVQIGRGHYWHYDESNRKETRITPDLWEISYAVTKRRVGHAPDFSGVPVGKRADMGAEIIKWFE